MPQNSAFFATSCSASSSRRRRAAVVAHDREQMVEPREIERLGQVVDGAQLDGFDGAVDRRVAAHQNDLAVGIGLADGAQDLDATDVGQTQIDGGDVGSMIRQLIERLFAGRARDDVEPASSANRVMRSSTALRRRRRELLGAGIGCHGRATLASSSSRTLVDSAVAVNGFCRNGVPGFSTPRFTIASSV